MFAFAVFDLAFQIGWEERLNKMTYFASGGT